jgi:ATP-binding cassette subfamily C (CFTR/MRP) protein 4
VSAAVYLGYLRSAGLSSALALLFLFVGGQLVALLADFWLKLWAESDASEQDERGPTSKFGIFSFLTALATVLSLVRSVLFFHVCLRAATTVHDAAVRRVVASPLAFFARNPLGRILNKFSSDLGQVDETLPTTLFDCFESLVLCCGAAVLCCLAVPWLLVLMVPVCVVLLRLRRFFVRSARELKRLEAVSKSPVYVAFANTIDGLVTIRAFRGAAAANQREFLERLERNGRAWYSWLLANRWVGVQLDTVSWVVLAATALGGVVLAGAGGSFDAGMLGFAITYAIQLSGVFQYTVRLSAKAETMMTSFERIQAYARLPAEPGRADPGPEKGGETREIEEETLETPGAKRGAVRIEGVSVRYREDLPLVLRDVTLRIEAGSKVGVVGRTGSGKSTLALALCRLNEVTGGRILIDGADAARMPVAALRRRIGFVPQEPVLFSGDLRFNLDPFFARTDAEVCEALRAVGLGAMLEDGSPGLSTAIKERGSNLSEGERQLISFARAILRRASVYVLDEATANVDYGTDDAIQRIVREAPGFRDATVVAVAHRISTIMDSDVVVVVDEGRIVETGPPAELMKRRGGHFASLVEASRSEGRGVRGVR